MAGNIGGLFKRYRFFFIALGALAAIQISLGFLFASYYLSAEERASLVQSVVSSLSSSSSPSASNHAITDFEPPCKVQGKEAVSAINRAKSVQCKQELANLACSESLYPKYLPNLCPTSTKIDKNIAGDYLGCYRDSFETRILTGNFLRLREENTKENCVDSCQRSGYAYAGTQYATECFK